MTSKVIVWGTGNVGRPALRAVLSHTDLELVGVIVSNPDKVGRDAGELVGMAPVGLAATDDWATVLASVRYELGKSSITPSTTNLG